MSTLTETLKDQKAPARDHRAAGFLANVIVTLVGWAIVAWLAGIALHRGFGISVPFTPAFILAFAGATAIKILALTVANAWFDTKTRAAGGIAAAEYMGQQSASLLLNPGRGDMFDEVLKTLLKEPEDQ